MTTSRHILLVEDEPTLQRILGSVLSDAGHSVESVGTAEQAMERLQGSGPEVIDLVLSDKNLPAMNGLDLLEKLRDQDRAEDSSRGFILVTGYPSRESAARVLELGGNGYLVKPFRSLLETAQEVQRVLDASQLALCHASQRAHALVDALIGEEEEAPGIKKVGIQTLDMSVKARLEERLSQVGLSVVSPDDAVGADAAVVTSSPERLKNCRRDSPDTALVLIDPVPAFGLLVELIRLGGTATLDPSQITAV